MMQKNYATVARAFPGQAAFTRTTPPPATLLARARQITRSARLIIAGSIGALLATAPTATAAVNAYRTGSSGGSWGTNVNWASPTFPKGAIGSCSTIRRSPP